MDIEDEEKMEPNEHSNEESGDDNENEEMDVDEALNKSSKPTDSKETPFLDSFYGLSSSDQGERSQAAQVMLHHCLLGPEANAKDSAYAFRRLLNGLCSGRAAARQGNASALASFLKIAFHMGKMDEIRTESKNDELEGTSNLSFVRQRLISATDPSQTTGKKKASEERDYQFGRLFGILGVVRSGILIPKKNGADEIQDIIKVSTNLVTDLVNLFWLKKWMREPAAHGIATLLNSFYCGTNADECRKVVKHLVEKVVIPKILQVDGSGKESKLKHSEFLESYCAEQIALAVYVQSQITFHKARLLFPLDKPVVSVGSLPFIGKSLSETSNTVHPRTHFVWDAIWLYLTEDETKEKPESPRSETIKRLRPKCPIGDDSAIDVVDAIIRVVLMEKLLRLESDGARISSKTTHERRSLALCVVKSLAGVPFVSSLTGLMQMHIDPDALENIVLTRELVRILFLDVICAGSEKKHSSHLLKPLALEVLDSLAKATSKSNDVHRQLAVVRALMKCETRFDTRTKTPTILNILGLGTPVIEASENHFRLWSSYFSYLENQFLLPSTNEELSISEQTGYVESIYSFAKGILRIETTKQETHSEHSAFKQSVLQKVLGLFMASAFFDCSRATASFRTKKSKGKKEKAEVQRPIMTAAMKLKEFARKGQEVPYATRSLVSARFFSLVADYVNYSLHHLDDSEGSSKRLKDCLFLDILTDLEDCWAFLESSGAIRFTSNTNGNEGSAQKEDAVESRSAKHIISDFQQRIKGFAELADAEPCNTLVEPRRRCATGIAILGLTLYLHLLSCGTTDDFMEDESQEDDDENEEEEINSAIETLNDVMDGFLQTESEGNPLLSLAESCANVLSSPLVSGNSTRGASPKLVKEAAKFAWLGGLHLSSATTSDSRTLLDTDVVNILLTAIGAPAGDETGNKDFCEEEQSDIDGDDDSSEGEVEGVFSKATDILGETENMEVDQKPELLTEGAEVSDSDVELDSSKLQSLLEEDSDAGVEVGELEHHEGADAALAKLIKMKQDARKAGYLAREKLEISNQLACTVLVELLFSRPEAYKNLFRKDVILRMLLPMLYHRKAIERSLRKASDKGATVGIGEKKALLDRLTSLLKSKLCKLRLAAIPCMESLDFVEFASSLASKIIATAKKDKSKEHSICCSHGFVLVLRAIPKAHDQVAVASICNDAIVEWSSKKNSSLETNFFEEWIVHMPR